jgi:sec-independent protein translocase protein TatA
MNLGAPELLIVLAVVLLLFGSTRLPKLARSLGQAKQQFEHGQQEPPSPVTSPPVVVEPAPRVESTGAHD